MDSKEIQRRDHTWRQNVLDQVHGTLRRRTDCGTATSIEANRALARRFIEEIANGDNLNIADELFAPEFETRDAVVPTAPGPEGVKRVSCAVRAAFPDFHETVEGVLADEDRVMVRWSTRGTTHLGPFAGIGPTGKIIGWRGVFILRVKNGQFVEMWQVHDTLGLLRQLGATDAPSPGSRLGLAHRMSEQARADLPHRPGSLV